jgi:hypothetical protein
LYRSQSVWWISWSLVSNWTKTHPQSSWQVIHYHWISWKLYVVDTQQQKLLESFHENSCSIEQSFSWLFFFQHFPRVHSELQEISMSLQKFVWILIKVTFINFTTSSPLYKFQSFCIVLYCELLLFWGIPTDLSTLDVIDAASLLMTFLNELPQPLLTNELKDEWNATKRNISSNSFVRF